MSYHSDMDWTPDDPVTDEVVEEVCTGLRTNRTYYGGCYIGFAYYIHSTIDNFIYKIGVFLDLHQDEVVTEQMIQEWVADADLSVQILVFRVLLRMGEEFQNDDSGIEKTFTALNEEYILVLKDQYESVAKDLFANPDIQKTWQLENVGKADIEEWDVEDFGKALIAAEEKKTKKESDREPDNTNAPGKTTGTNTPKPPDADEDKGKKSAVPKSDFADILNRGLAEARAKREQEAGREKVSPKLAEPIGSNKKIDKATSILKAVWFITLLELFASLGKFCGGTSILLIFIYSIALWGWLGLVLSILLLPIMWIAAPVKAFSWGLWAGLAPWILGFIWLVSFLTPYFLMFAGYRAMIRNRGQNEP